MTRTAPDKSVTARARPHTAGPTAQQLLLRAAGELFYREGIRAVGVDAVVERAGVNKMSLYRQFSSKDELVVAYLEQANAFSSASITVSISTPAIRSVRSLNISRT